MNTETDTLLGHLIKVTPDHFIAKLRPDLDSIPSHKMIGMDKITIGQVGSYLIVNQANTKILCMVDSMWLESNADGHEEKKQRLSPLGEFGKSGDFDRALDLGRVQVDEGAARPSAGVEEYRVYVSQGGIGRDEHCLHRARVRSVAGKADGPDLIRQGLQLLHLAGGQSNAIAFRSHLPGQGSAKATARANDQSTLPLTVSHAAVSS